MVHAIAPLIKTYTSSYSMVPHHARPTVAKMQFPKQGETGIIPVEHTFPKNQTLKTVFEEFHMTLELDID